MNLLLDTHALLWWLIDDARLGPAARAAIEDARNSCAVSAATIWEISIKTSLGKLEVPEDVEDQISREGFATLAVSAEHAWEVGRLPHLHRDPFDRMLVAQCRVEGMTLVTHDDTLASYAVAVLRA